MERRDDSAELAGSWHWLVPLLGVIFVALVVVSVALTAGSPDSSSSGLTVVNYFLNHRDQQFAAAICTIIAIPVGLFFFGLLRGYLSRSRESRTMTAIGFAGVVVFAAGGCISAGMQLALADVPGRLTLAAAQTLNILNNDLGFPLIVAGVSALQFGFGISILRTKLLPAWVGWLSVAIGVVALIGPIGFIGFAATGLWILIVSVLLYERTASHLAAGPTTARPPA
jgi:hypothetical protein